MYPSLTISNEALKRCAGGELWLSIRDVMGRKPKIAGIVNIIDRKKKFVAMAFLSPASRYALRIFSRKPEPAGKDFWHARINKASARRAPLEKITNAFRVVHGDSDGMSSIAIDKYDDVFALQITSEGAETIKKEIVQILIEEFKPRTIVEKNAGSIRKSEKLPLIEKIVYGTNAVATIREGDQHFEVDVLAGQKTGAYLDYRAFRLKARELACGDCLDAFCYQGWFSCQIAGRAKSVLAIDSSAAALEAGRRNAKINGHENIEFMRADVLEYLKKCGRSFDFIHLDPPSFAKGGGKLPVAIAGYRKLLRDALAVLKPGGILMVSSCSHAVTEGVLERTVTESLTAAGLKGKVVWRGIQDIDHPVLQGFSESLYLKALAVKTV